MNYTVILTPKEIEYCQRIAKMRTDENLDRGAVTSLRNHIDGCYGEYAVSKCFGLPWEGIYYEDETWENRGNDVKGIEVKASFKYDNGINLDPKDPGLFPDTPFVFVRLTKMGNKIGATLMGWIWGHEANEDEKGTRLTSRIGKEFLMVRKKHFYEMDDLPKPS